MFFPLPKSMYWQAPIWPQFHVDQFAMHAAGITKYQFDPLQMAIGVADRLHRAVQRRHDLAPRPQGLKFGDRFIWSPLSNN